MKERIAASKIRRSQSAAPENWNMQVRMEEIPKNELMVVLGDTVADLRRRIKKELGMKVMNNIMFGELRMRDSDQRIIDYGIMDGSVVKLHKG